MFQNTDMKVIGYKIYNNLKTKVIKNEKRIKRCKKIT